MQNMRPVRARCGTQIRWSIAVHTSGKLFLGFGIVNPRIRRAIDDVRDAHIANERTDRARIRDVELRVGAYAGYAAAVERVEHGAREHPAVARDPDVQRPTLARNDANDSAC